MRKRVLYYGWLGHDNLGDEALFVANRRLLPGLRLVPYERRRWSWRRPTACLLGGGTYINDRDSVERVSRIQRAMPFGFFGVGVQNPRYWSTVPGYVDTRAKWNRVLRDSPLVSVRGPHSMETLRSQGYLDALVVGDPALSLADSNLVRRAGRHVGLNLGNTSGRLWGGDDGVVYRAVRDLARRLLRERFKVSLLAVCPEDTATLSALRREIGDVELHSYYEWSPDVSAYFRTVDIFVGLKLHSVVLAHCAYVPSVMIEYRPKCRDYMASLGLEEWTVRSDDADIDRLYHQICELLKTRDEHQDLLFTGIAGMIEKQRAFAREFTELVGGT